MSASIARDLGDALGCLGHVTDAPTQLGGTV
jgi:tRNA U55 pseudouridine synthase TruB